MKRFRIREDQNFKLIIFRAATTQEIYDHLLTLDMGLNSYMVECAEDDIEIDADEFIDVFKVEAPGDLQFF